MVKRDRFAVPDPRSGGLGPVAYRPDAGMGAARSAAEATLLGIEGVCGVGEGRDGTGAEAWVCYVLDSAAAARVPAALEGRPVLVEITGEIDIQAR